MVTAESLCCGTPVVGFKAGAPEQITIDKYSTFVNYADIDALQKAIENIVVFNAKEIEQDAHNKYDKNIMATKYVEIYEKI